MRACVAETSGADAQRVLREWRRREMLRIAWRDIGAAPVETYAAYRISRTPVSGRPPPSRRASHSVLLASLAPGGEEVPLIVLGMGKLGGRELNFSSDVDLVFLFRPVRTDGARVLDNQEYFNRLGRELIRLLDARTEEVSCSGWTCGCDRSGTAGRWW